MILDSSAILAILFGEKDAEIYWQHIIDDDKPEISAGTLLETRMIAYRRNMLKDLDELLARLELTIVPFDKEICAIALDSYIKYGRSPAKLNFGDCFSYATARYRRQPLLYKGSDFAHTDIKRARDDESF